VLYICLMKLITLCTHTVAACATRTCPDNPGNRQHMPSTGGPPGEIIIKRSQRRKLQRKCYRYTCAEARAKGRWAENGGVAGGMRHEA